MADVLGATFSEGPPAKYTISVYGKYQDPQFQMFKKAAENLSMDRIDVAANVEGCFESQYEQQLRHLINKYGGPFVQAKPSAPLIFAETDDDKVLYFLNDKRFFEWAYKRFKYEDNTRLIFYKRIGIKSLQAVREATGRSYCALSVTMGDEQPETVHFELFDEECPVLAKNFLDLLADSRFDGHTVHRVKAGAWVQAGDLVDGSGQNSAGAQGDFLRHESFQIPHDRGGLLGMSNQGKDTNGSQFYVTVKDLPFLNGRSVIFGRVISGMRTIMKISKVQTKNERPVQDIKLAANKEFLKVGALQNQQK
jgi:cyclophilin family peptidyl-prolyl cis-trans isomerase